MRSRWIIIGLGNPGHRYRDTRHNVGFWFVDYLSHRWDFPLFRVVDNILVSKGRAGRADVLLLKPATYMNRSGLALATLSRVEDYRPEELLVCHDDLDIPVGRFKLKASGGAGGHKGVRSILGYVGNEDVARMKFGILPGEKPADVESFVLSPFEKEEEKKVTDLFPRAQEAVECLVAEGIGKAMSLYNRNVSDQVDQEV
jgi:PTH1 family peptidyl-tRNA hydrolase